MAVDQAVRKYEQYLPEKQRKDEKPSAKKSSKRKPVQLSQDEITELILENQVDAEKMAWKILGSLRVQLTKDDVKSIVGIALCEAAVRFDPSYETSFKTFFYYHLRGILLKEVTEVISFRKVLSFGPRMVHGESDYYNENYLTQVSNLRIDRRTPEKLLQEKEVSELCEEACSYLDDLEREVIERYFFNDEPLVRIAEELGYCRCHLSRVKNSALKQLGELLEPLTSSGNTTIESVMRSGGMLRVKNDARSRYTGGRGRRRTEEEVRPRRQSRKRKAA